MQKNKLNTNSNILVSFKSHSEISKKKDANKADAMLIASYFYENLRSE